MFVQGIGPFKAAPAKLMVVLQVTNDNRGTKTPADFMVHVTGKNPQPFSFPGATSGVEVVLERGDYAVAVDPVSGYAVSTSSDCSGSVKGGEVKTCTVTSDDEYAPATIQTQLKLGPVLCEERESYFPPTEFTLETITKYDRPAEEMEEVLGYVPVNLSAEDSALVLKMHMVNKGKSYGGRNYGEATPTSRLFKINGEEVVIAPVEYKGGEGLPPLSSGDMYIVYSVPKTLETGQIIVGSLECPLTMNLDFRELRHSIVEETEEAEKKQ